MSESHGHEAPATEKHEEKKHDTEEHNPALDETIEQAGKATLDITKNALFVKESTLVGDAFNHILGSFWPGKKEKK